MPVNTRLLMPKGTANWLVDHTSLTFKQIADFCGIHELEVKSLADGITYAPSNNPVTRRQLTREEITRCESDPEAGLCMEPDEITALGKKARRSRYTPISVRVNRPHAIAWLLRYHPELSDTQVRALVGTTANTIRAIREKRHAQMNELNPRPPSDLGLCTEEQLQETISEAKLRQEEERMRQQAALEAARKAKEESVEPVDSEQ